MLLCALDCVECRVRMMYKVVRSSQSGPTGSWHGTWQIGSSEKVLLHTFVVGVKVGKKCVK